LWKTLSDTDILNVVHDFGKHFDWKSLNTVQSSVVRLL
jgi:hypothetical protein